MALVIKDRVKETTTTTGTGTVTLAGAVSGFQSFSAIGNGNSTYYVIADPATGDWEVGIGTYTSSGTTLSRTTILSSSNAGSAVSFAAGIKDVFDSYPSSRAVYQNEAGNATVQSDFGTINATTANLTTAALTNGTISTTPSSANDITNKTYVDTLVASGIHFHQPVRVESPPALTATYNNGTAGVGATLTNAGAQAALVIDGVTVSVADRVLIYTQSTQTQNGIYVVTSVGSGSTNWILTRSSDADTYVINSAAGLSEGSTVFVQEGSTGAGETYTCNTSGVITFGTTNITFAQISSAQIYSAGTGLTLSGTQFSITNTGTAGTYGSASAVPVFTTNAQGQVTSVTNTAIAITGAAVSGNIAGQAGSVANALTAGTYLTSGGTYDGSAARTFAVDATSANTASKVVARDGSGNFSAGTITATLSGAATSATTATNLAGGAANQLAVQAGSGSTTFVTAPSASGQVLRWNGSSFDYVAGTISGASLGGNISTLTFGTFLTGTSYNGTSAVTIATNGTNANTASTLVARDASGNFSAGTITATLSGSATSASTAGTITNQANSATITATSNNTANQIVLRDGSGNFSAGTITATLSGNASTATSATTAGSITSQANSATITATSTNTANQIVLRDGSGNFSAGTITASLAGNATTATTASSTSGNAATATALSSGQSNWSGTGVINNVVGMLAWKNYGNGHVIFDASNGTSPSGGAVNNTNAAIAWSGTYPTLMGWNGSSTYGVRVDSARIADSITSQANSATITASTSAGAANTIVLRDGNGYIFNNYFNSTDNSVASGVSAVMVKAGDNYLRSGTAGAIATFISGQTMNINGSSTSCSGNAATATTATNQSGGTINATTGAFSGQVTQSGNSATIYGPNSTWGAFLQVGGNGRTVSGTGYASVVATDGNLHLDSGTSNGLYLNYYAGTAGINFGNGASGIVGTMSAAGALTMTSFSGAGTGLTGTASSLSIGGNAATATIASSITSQANSATITASTSAGAANTIVLRDGNGYIFNNYFNSTDNSQSSGVSAVMVKAGDNYLRSGTAAAVATFISGQTMNINGSSTSCSGNAATATTATTATTANALATGNNYQVNSLGVGTAGSGTAGEIRATNNVTAFYSSDIKFKENVRDIPNAAATAAAIGGKLFDWTDAYIADHGGADGYFVQKHDFGIIAQDALKHFPVAVRTRPDGSLAVDYEKLSALALAAVAEQEVRIAKLEALVAKLIEG